MEGTKHTFQGHINDKGVLQVNMDELREKMRKHPGKQAIMTVEILDGGDIQMMLARYRNYMLPKIVEAFRELGENYTADRADVELIKHTTVRKKTVGHELWVIPLESLDREMMKQWIDEVTYFASINLHIAL